MAAKGRPREGRSVIRTRSRSVKHVADAKLEKTSLSADVLKRSFMPPLLSRGLRILQAFIAFYSKHQMLGKLYCMIRYSTIL